MTSIPLADIPLGTSAALATGAFFNVYLAHARWPYGSRAMGSIA